MSSEPLESLATIIEALDEAGVPHMLAGSFASSHHGVPRSTADIDLVVEVGDATFDRLLDTLDTGRFYVPVDTARRERRLGGQFNLIDLRTGWKIDLIFRRDRPFSRVEFERRHPATVAGVQTYLASAEDTILAKLEWGAASGSERQWRDVVEILRARAGDLDDTYLDHWAPELGVEAELARVRDAVATT
ncbi:MAG TPA: hypothetical protein VFN21_09750 [Acidimicrobiales bacterium]|nr:hypothetical protein [Acidimicrobiales bacterium]